MALCAVALVCVAIIGGGYMLSFVLLPVKLATAVMPSDTHTLSIIFGEASGRADLFEPTLHAIVLAVAIAAVWFAPALIVLQNQLPLEAILSSLRAVFHNDQIALVYVAVLAVDALLGLVAPVLVHGLVLTPLTRAASNNRWFGAHAAAWRRAEISHKRPWLERLAMTACEDPTKLTHASHLLTEPIMEEVEIP